MKSEAATPRRSLETEITTRPVPRLVSSLHPMEQKALLAFTEQAVSQYGARVASISLYGTGQRTSRGYEDIEILVLTPREDEALEDQLPDIVAEIVVDTADLPVSAVAPRADRTAPGRLDPYGHRFARKSPQSRPCGLTIPGALRPTAGHRSPATTRAPGAAGSHPPASRPG
ncbi:MAG: hypothetical protein HY815_07130 [Candidatus Riflebacteria bacterium]|nr:hypothetical protein [Candidatus Riflebacteria bacterium]